MYRWNRYLLHPHTLHPVREYVTLKEMWSEAEGSRGLISFIYWHVVLKVLNPNKQQIVFFCFFLAFIFFKLETKNTKYIRGLVSNFLYISFFILNFLGSKKFRNISGHIEDIKETWRKCFINYVTKVSNWIFFKLFFWPDLLNETDSLKIKLSTLISIYLERITSSPN